MLRRTFSDASQNPCTLLVPAARGDDLSFTIECNITCICDIALMLVTCNSDGTNLRASLSCNMRKVMYLRWHGLAMTCSVRVTALLAL